MKAKTFWRLAIAGLVLPLLGGGIVLAWAWQEVHQPHRGYGDAELVLEIRSGEDAGGILHNLAQRGVVANPRLARLYLVYFLKDPPLRAGEYRFRAALSTHQVLEKLIRGDVVRYKVTLVEGLTLDETAEHLAAAGFGNREALKAAMMRSDEIADWDPQATSLEGYLFPDTYSFAKGTPETKVVSALVGNFRQRFAGEIQGRVGHEDTRRIVTLASIVEKEAQLAEERSLIAGVYANRLRRGIGLYADPTIIYALKQLGRWDGNLRRPDLKLDSPYNTYLYPGLPPGPICSPGLASLKAAALPADTPFLYFVSRNDGSHVFARTLAEHTNNVNRWQKRYWRDRWARQRGSSKLE